MYLVENGFEFIRLKLIFWPQLNLDTFFSSDNFLTKVKFLHKATSKHKKILYFYRDQTRSWIKILWCEDKADFRWVTDLAWNHLMVLNTDYSWSAYFKGVHAQGRFPPDQQDLCINSKETIAMHNGYCSFEPYFQGSHLLIRSDNTMAIAFFFCCCGELPLLSPLRNLTRLRKGGKFATSIELADQLFHERACRSCNVTVNSSESCPNQTQGCEIPFVKCSSIANVTKISAASIKTYKFVSWYP